MRYQDIARQRLLNQRVASTELHAPAQVVAWLGAVQAQEYALAKWALGLRMAEAVDHTVEDALTSGAVVRTHVLRPTWHFVTPPDLRWLLMLTGPRVHAANRSAYRELELDDALLRRIHVVITEALTGETYLTRPEVGAALAAAGIEASGRRLSYIMMHAELAGLVCSGPRRGKQFTYALLDERVPPTPALPREEALAELIRRFFTSRGPATVKDFAWWSGLTVADTKAGLAAVGPALSQTTIEDEIYWFASPAGQPNADMPRAYLLPPFDEYTSYRSLSGVPNPAYREKLKNSPFSGAIVLDERVAGTWRRTVTKGEVTVEAAPLRPFTDEENAAVASAVRRFGEFLEMPAVLA
jgi:hypothetical protein